MPRLPRHSTTNVLVTTAAAGALLLAPAVGASATSTPSPVPGLGIRLLDAPTSLSHDPRAAIYIIDHLAPGAQITRHLQVSNGDKTPMHLELYPAAARINRTGFAVEAGRARNDITGWTTMTPRTIDLLPGHTAEVTVHIAVPSDAVEGEQYEALLAQTQPEKQTGGRFAVSSRVGIRVYLSIGTGGMPPSDFRVSTLTAWRDDTGVPHVSAKVTNIGQRALDLTGSLTLSDGPGGLRAGPFQVQHTRTLGIGQTGLVDVPLDPQLPAGPWHARMALQSGEIKHAVEATIRFPVANGATSPPVAAKPVPLTQRKSVVWPVAAAILALLIGFWLFLFWRRRRRRDDEQPGPGVVPEQREADDSPVGVRSR